AAGGRAPDAAPDARREAPLGRGKGTPRAAPRARPSAPRARRAPRRRVVRFLVVPLCLAACAPRAPVAEVADALSARAGDDVAGDEPHWRAVLADYLARAKQSCLPPADEVLAAPGGDLPARRVHGSLAHYDFFDGPVRYRVGAAGGR